MPLKCGHVDKLTCLDAAPVWDYVGAAGRAALCCVARVLLKFQWQLQLLSDTMPITNDGVPLCQLVTHTLFHLHLQVC